MTSRLCEARQITINLATYACDSTDLLSGGIFKRDVRPVVEFVTKLRTLCKVIGRENFFDISLHLATGCVQVEMKEKTNEARAGNVKSSLTLEQIKSKVRLYDTHDLKKKVACKE